MPIVYAGQAFTIGNNVAYSGNGYGAAKLLRCTVGYDLAISGKRNRINSPRLRGYSHQRANLGCISADNRDAQFTQQTQGALKAESQVAAAGAGAGFETTQVSKRTPPPAQKQRSKLPVVVGAILYTLNPSLMSVLFSDPRGRYMLGLAVLSLIIGVAVMALIIRRTLRY